MADENKTPEEAANTEQQTPNPSEVAEESRQTTDPSAAYPTDNEAEKLPEPLTPLEEGVADAIRASEALQATPPVQAWDTGVRGVMESMEAVADAPTEPETHHYGDTVVLPTGQTITVHGGIYTVVFGALAALTVFEVAIAEIFGGGFLKTAALVVLSLGKAVLVVTFYMHLNRDSRLYWVALGLPLLIVLLSVLFLLAAPPDGSLSY